MISENKIKEYVIPYYADKDLMHDLSHIERVLNNVNKYVLNYQDEVNLDIIRYAAYFHGIIYNFEREIRYWLLSTGLPRNITNLVITVAWESQKDEVPLTLEGKILHDAHMTEGGKVFLLVKSLITGSVRGQSLEETIDYIEDNIIGNGECYLPEAKVVYKLQQKYARNFIRDLKKGIY